MSKFKIHFKLQGLELDVEGTRDDLPAIGHSIGNQIASLIEPAIGLSDGMPRNEQRAAPSLIVEADPRKKARRKKTSNGAATSDATDSSINWKHDSVKFGMPSQNWNTAKKAIWLLYVVKENLNRTSLTAKQISDAFNLNFKQAGAIQSFNVTRDLGNAKVKTKPAPVGEDTSKDPHQWYLTDAGVAQAQQLIAATEN